MTPSNCVARHVNTSELKDNKTSRCREAWSGLAQLGWPLTWLKRRASSVFFVRFNRIRDQIERSGSPVGPDAEHS